MLFFLGKPVGASSPSVTVPVGAFTDKPTYIQMLDGEV